MSLLHASRRLWYMRNEYPDQPTDFWYWSSRLAQDPSENHLFGMIWVFLAASIEQSLTGRRASSFEVDFGGFVEVPRGFVLF